MSWTDTMYLQNADEAAWNALKESLGALTESRASIYICTQPTAPYATPPVWGEDANGELVLTDPGTLEPGYWVMMRLNETWDGCADALAAIAAAAVLRTLTDPPWAFA